jgi:hypothetical protein
MKILAKCVLLGAKGRTQNYLGILILFGIADYDHHYQKKRKKIFERNILFISGWWVYGWFLFSLYTFLHFLNIHLTHFLFIV